MFQNLVRAILIVALFPVVSSATWKDLLHESETLSNSGNLDSAAVVFEQALESAQTQYTASDSTVDIQFYEEGAPKRCYFSSYNDAAQLYEEFLAAAEKTFGEDHALVATVLLRLAETYRVLGRYYDAEPLSARALKIREDTFGAGNAAVAEALDKLGMIYFHLARYEEAAAFCDSSLMMRERIYGIDHPEVAWSCLNLAEALVKLGVYDVARQLTEKATAIVQDRFGADGLEMADCYEMMGFVHYYRDENAEAESQYLKALEIRRTLLGGNHPLVATMLFRLANVYRYIPKFKEADSLFVESLRLRVSAFGENHPDVGEVYHYLAVHYRHELGVIDSATSLYSRALENRNRYLGRDHPDTRDTRHRLGICFMDLGRFVEALPLFETNLDIVLAQYGPNDGRVADALHQRGLTMSRLGRFDEAVADYKRCLSIKENLHGPDHPRIAKILNSMAITYDSQGKYEEAASLLRRGLTIMANSPDYKDPRPAAELALNLAMVYLTFNRFHEAESLTATCLAVYDEHRDTKQAQIATILLNLGLAFEGEGRFEEADSVYRLSVEIGEEELGLQSPVLAHALNNWANMNARLGRYHDAETMQQRAVAILESALGPEHPELSKFRRDQGRIYAWSGKADLSRKSFDKFIDWTQRYLENVFPYSSEDQKLRWIREYPLLDNVVLSLALKEKDITSNRLALEMLLKSKAMVIEAVMAEKQAAYCHYDDEMMVWLDELSGINTQIASLSMAGGYYRDSVAHLYDVKDSLEVELSRHCSEFSDALAARRFELDDVAAAVPVGSALWEFTRYEPVDLSADVLGDDKKGDPRYLAFTMNHDGEITINDLGDAATIDSLIVSARDLIYKAQGQIYSVAAVTAEQRLNDVTSKLHEMLFAPLTGNSTDIYISPDGMLNLLPFEILPQPNQSYVIEDYQISYLSSGRDLLKHGGAVASDGAILVLADPDFDNLGQGNMPVDTLGEQFGPEMRGNTDCLTKSFNPLPFSRNEAQSVVACFNTAGKTNVRQCYGNKAAEETLKDLMLAPSVLHLATHGFFCESDESATALKDNPLLRSGLALAGANRTISGERDESGEDGILTALEVSGLNLVGTDLAVLSACETGVGEFVNGEGLFGLRRAFQHAGAETVVMSLWAVPDRETSQLMDGFYRRWLGGLTKRDALRESAIELLSNSRDKRGCGHPLLWGGFILAGNPN